LAIGTPNLHQAVEKARARAAGLDVDLGALADCVRQSRPAALNDEADKRERRAFLGNLYSEDRLAKKAYERIIEGNELQGANYLARGALVARTVLRIVIRDPAGRLLGYGSGFLIGDDVLITNNHVLPDSGTAGSSQAEAFYEYGLLGEDLTVERFALEPQRLFYTSTDLDFTIVAVAPSAIGSGAELADIGWLPLIGTPGKAMEGEWLTIVQHPLGERKQLCVRENQLIKRDTDVLWYSTDTLAGSSGSSVHNNDWLVVALHHMGVPETKNGKWQTIEGRDYDPARDDETKIKWIANEGIRVSRIVETLRTDNAIAAHPMVVRLLDVGIADIGTRLPVMFRDGKAPPAPLPDMRRPGAQAGPLPQPSSTASTETDMARRTITLTLAIDDDGSVSIQNQGAAEASLMEAAAAAPKKDVIDAPVDPAKHWTPKTKGYDPAFLGEGKLVVNLPEVVEAKQDIAPLKDAYGHVFTPAQRAAGVLDYINYSVVMNAKRRFAFFSAANVNGGMRPRVSGRTDNWLFDDRISTDHQLGGSYYKNDSFDRGHLTRREDLEWGETPEDAVRSANNTCTWTNCTPQHSIFNQDKDPDPAVQLWQGLERYILEQTAAYNKFNIQTITGPIFGAGDPVFRDIAYPLEFWKVVVAVDSAGELFATGYILSQKDVIAQFGLGEAAQAVPFGAYATYQRPISLIESATGLKFTSGGAQKVPLTQADPLGGKRPARAIRRPRVRTQEAFGAPQDDALQSFDDIVLR